MALLFCWMAWKKESWAVIASICILAGCLFLVQDYRSQDHYDYSQPYNGQLQFSNSAAIDGDSLRGFAKLDDGTRVYARYRFTAEEEKDLIEQLLQTSSFHVAGVFEEADPPSHDYSFDMQAYLDRNGVSYILSIGSIEGAVQTGTVLTALYRQREAMKHHIQKHFPESLATEAEALLVGEQENMTVEDQRIYQTLGITHLFAISGLHVAIIAGIVYFVLVRLRIRKESALAVMLVVLPLYAVIAGGAPSVWRSVAMVCTVLLCRLIGMKLPIAHILLGSFIFFILWNPYMMYNIGFQLSYGATFGIIYSRRFLSGSSLLKSGFIITFISQLTLYPLLLFHFYEISLSAFIVNSLFVPLYTVVILPINLILLAFTFVFHPLADGLFYVYEPVRGWIGRMMAGIAGLPYQMWNPGKPEPLMMPLLFASVLAFYHVAEKRFRFRQLLILIVPALVFSSLPYLDPALKVTFLDVGQGDSAIIEMPYRKSVYVIDTGGLLRFDTEEFKKRDRPFEIGRQVVVPYLKGNGISSVDLLVLSHADADHAEGAEELFESLVIHQLHLSPGSAETDIMQELAPYAKEAAVQFPGRGSGWREGDVHFSYLSPDDADYEGNNDSLVLMLQSGEWRILFTGDLEEAGEMDLLRTYGEQLKGVALLKVGHHGSKTSSSQPFLEVLQPQLSIFSTGRNNRYGHPSKEVVERFAELGLPTLNTAEVGTIEFSFRDGQVSWETTRAAENRIPEK